MNMKKILSLILSGILLTSVLPCGIQAEEAEQKEEMLYLLSGNTWKEGDRKFYEDRGISFESYDTGATYQWLDGTDAGVLQTDPESKVLQQGGPNNMDGNYVVNSEWKKKGTATALFDLKSEYWVKQIDSWTVSRTNSQVEVVKVRIGETLDNMKELPSVKVKDPTQAELDASGDHVLTEATVSINATKARYVELTFYTEQSHMKMIVGEVGIFGYLEKPLDKEIVVEETEVPEEKIFSKVSPEINAHNTYIADLGAMYEITKTDVKQYNSAVNGLSDYEVWLSADGRNYMYITSARAVNPIDYKSNTISCPIREKMYARYVKFVMNKIPERDGVLIQNIDIFGKPGVEQRRIDTEATYSYYTQTPYRTADDVRLQDREHELLMDGDTQTVVTSREDAWMTVVIDLKKAYQIGDIDIYSLAQGNTFFEGCEIRYSLDGKKFFTYTYYLNHNKKNSGIGKSTFSGMPGRNARFLKIILQSSKKDMAISEITVSGYPVEMARTKEPKPVPLRVELKNYLLAYLDWSTYNNDNTSRYALYVDKNSFTDTTNMKPTAVYERYDDAFIYKYATKSYLEPETTYYFAVTPFNDDGVENTKVTPVQLTTPGVLGTTVRDIFNIVDHPNRKGGGNRGWGTYHTNNVAEAVRLLDEMGGPNKTRLWTVAPEMTMYADVGISTMQSNYRDASWSYGSYMFSNGNEADLSKTDTDLFVRDMKQLYKKAKNLDPRSVIINPVLGGTEKGSMEWFDDFYKSGNGIETKNHFDAVDVHLYCKYGDPQFPGLPTVSPEMLYKKVELVRDVMRKYDDGDKPIVSTEVGFHTADINSYQPKVTYEEQRDLVVRLYMILISLGLKEVWYYNFQDYGHHEHYEMHWGLIDYFGVPKPGYYSFYNMYQQMRNVEYIGAFPGIANPYYGNEFYNETKNEIISVVWAADGQTKTMTFSTVSGEDETIEVIGCDGSFQVVETVNGRGTVSIGRGPIYIYSKAGVKADSISIAFSAEKTSQQTIRGKDVTFRLQRKTLGEGMSGKVTAQNMPAGYAIVNDTTFDTTQSYIDVVVRVPETAKEQEEAFTLNVVADNGVFVPIRVQIDVKSSIQISVLPEPVDKGTWSKWRLAAYCTNVVDVPVSGTLAVNSAEGINITTLETQKLENLMPGETRILYFDISERPVLQGAVGSFVLEVNGQQKQFDRTLNFSACVNDGITPTLDGVISQGEWDNCHVVENNPYEPTNTWDGPADASFKIYRKWDDKNFYMAVDVTDDIQSQPYTGVTIWQGDCVQFALDPARVEGVGISSIDYFELGLSMSDAKQELLTYAWYADLVVKKDKPISCEGTVKRTEDNHTIYEIAIPWQYIQTAPIKENQCIGFSAAYMDKDLTERREDRLAFMKGIDQGKDPNLFEDMILIKM